MFILLCLVIFTRMFHVQSISLVILFNTHNWICSHCDFSYYFSVDVYSSVSLRSCHVLLEPHEGDRVLLTSVLSTVYKQYLQPSVHPEFLSSSSQVSHSLFLFISFISADEIYRSQIIWSWSLEQIKGE